MTWRNRLLCLLTVGAVASVGHAAECADPRGMVQVREIHFEGNEVTRRSTLMREISFEEGAYLCADRLEAGRQAILDLRLFREVTLETESLDGDAVAVTYSVRERWYLLPVPRIDASSDADFGYGATVSWSNVGGMNHRLSVSGVRKELQERTLDDETTLSGRYDWRRFGGSRNNVSLSAGYSSESAVAGERQFQEETISAGFGVSRQLTSLQTAQGWSVSTGLSWNDSRSNGADAPPDDGSLTNLQFGTSYRDLHSQVYSDYGTSFGVSMSSQVPAVSDYNQFELYASAARFLRVGEREHQTFHLLAEMGSFHGGPRFRRSDQYELGGAGALRGYENEYSEGDSYWYLAAEWLRPLYWDWLRGLIALEVGDTPRSNFDTRDNPIMLSVGVGFRIRLTWFVDAEFELGIAYPLVRGDGARGFAGGAG